MGPLVATQKPGITNNRQFSSNSPMRFLVTPRRQTLNLVLNLVCRSRRLSFNFLKKYFDSRQILAFSLIKKTKSENVELFSVRGKVWRLRIGISYLVRAI